MTFTIILQHNREGRFLSGSNAGISALKTR